jgi:hypothetical protein
MTMQYRLIFYNKTTDKVGGLIDIPGVQVRQVVRIARVRNQKEPGEILLDDEQVRDIASLIPFKPDLSRFIYHLEPLG